MLVAFDTPLGRRLAWSADEIGAMEDRARRQKPRPDDLAQAPRHRTTRALEAALIVAHAEYDDGHVTALADWLQRLAQGRYLSHPLTVRVWSSGWAVLGRAVGVPAGRLRRVIRGRRPAPGESLASLVARSLLRH